MDTAQIELHLLNYRLRILTIKKQFIHKFMYPICKIAFTTKTNCSFFSFTETNDDYSIVVDQVGFNELESFINNSSSSSSSSNIQGSLSSDECFNEVKVSSSNWIPCSLSGDDLPGSMSISKIAKFIILPLADCAISIMAISMYQCDYILFQEKDYETVIKCLANHMTKIYDESLSQENEIVFMRKKNENLWSQYFTAKYSGSTSNNHSVAAKSSKNNNSTNKQSTNEAAKTAFKNGNITLPLIIPDLNEYCITGLYKQIEFQMIIPTLMEIMFYETSNYGDNEIFFNFTKKESDISLVLETDLLRKFPNGILLNVQDDYWKLIRIGQLSVSLEIFGVCASISHPLEMANIDEYYISSYHTGYCFIPSDKLSTAKELFAKRQATILTSNSTLSGDSFSNKSFNSSVNNNKTSDRNNTFDQHQTIFSDDFHETNQQEQQQQLHQKSHTILNSKHKLPASSACNIVPKMSSSKLHGNKEPLHDDFYASSDRKHANEEDEVVEYYNDDDDEEEEEEEDGERKVSYATSHRTNSTFAQDECINLHSPLQQQS